MQFDSFLLTQYKAIPVVSRMIFTIGLVLTILTYLDIVSPYLLVYSWQHMKKLELWRAVSSFFFWGPATLDVIIHQAFMLKYSVMLEEACSTSSDFLFMIFVGMVTIFILGSSLGLTKFSNSLSTYLIYIWSKSNPQVLVQYMGLFSLPAYYIPSIMFIFSFVLERKLPLSDLVGIISGHIFFYLKNVATREGRNIMKTPEFLKRLLGESQQIRRDGQRVYAVGRAGEEGSGRVEDEGTVG